jgi:hypothetical protein
MHKNIKLNHLFDSYITPQDRQTKYIPTTTQGHSYNISNKLIYQNQCCESRRKFEMSHAPDLAPMAGVNTITVPQPLKFTYRPAYIQGINIKADEISQTPKITQKQTDWRTAHTIIRGYKRLLTLNFKIFTFYL